MTSEQRSTNGASLGRWRGLPRWCRLLVAVVVACSLGYNAGRLAGRLVNGPGESSGDGPVMSLPEVLDLLELVGVVCGDELDAGNNSDGDFVTCRAEPRFDLHVSESNEAARRSFDVATAVGCFTIGGTPPTRWYLAHLDNWNLLTRSRSTAEALSRVRGVTVTMGRCDVPTGSEPV